MKVLVLSNNIDGLHSFRFEVMEAIRKENELWISCPRGEKTAEFEKIGCVMSDAELDRRGTNVFADLKLYRYYKKLIKEIKPDIVFTYTIKPNVYGGIACRKLRVPYVANITGLGTAVENGGLLQKFTLFLYKKGLKKAKKVFFQNSENRDFMIDKGVVRSEYDMLPGSGVNLERYAALEYPHGETVDFVFISRVMSAKGIDQFLDAAKYIRSKYAFTRFHVCGSCDEDYTEELKMLDEEGVITYHGQVSDIRTVHGFSACTVHPTYYPEGMSNVLLESCASARPIITTDRAGCREIVEDGVNGYVVKPKDASDVISKIEEFLALSWEQRRNMGLAGREKVVKEFDRRIVIEKYLAEIDGVRVR